MQRARRCVFAARVASTFGIAGQTTRPQFDAFEVATIKPTDPDSGAGRWIRMQSADRFQAHNHAERSSPRPTI